MPACPFMKRNAVHFQEMIRQADDDELAEAKAIINRFQTYEPDYIKKPKRRAKFVTLWMKAFGHSVKDWLEADREGRAPF